MHVDRPHALMKTVSRKVRSAIHAVRVERFFALAGPPRVVEPKIPCEIQCVNRYTRDVADVLTRVKGFDVNWKRRFDFSHRCYLTLCGGKAVGYGWASLGTWLMGLEEPLGMLAPDVGFIYDEITLESHRGNRLGPARLAHMANDLATIGYLRSCQLIADDNVPSQRSALAAGYQRTESVVRMHRFAMRFRIPEGCPPPEFRCTAHPHYFAAATAHLVLGR